MNKRACLALAFLLCVQGAYGNLEQQRQLYREADKAVKRADWKQVKELSERLQDYPLALYLDYAYLEARLRHVSGERAVEFVDKSVHSPLQLRFKGKYLKRAGRDRRWDDFLAVSRVEPNSEDLRCYYFRARRARGDLDAAWAGARKLWLSGRSIHKACDPLLKKWIQAGQLSDELVWERMLLAFDAYRGSLMAYVGRQGSEALQPRVEILKEIYHYPSRLSRTSRLPKDEAWALDVISHGFPRLAQRDLKNAMRLWRSLEQSYPLTPAQREKIGDALASRIIQRKTGKWRGWLDDYLHGRGNDELLQRRLRWAVRDGEWDHIASLIVALSDAERRKPAWRYWYAHSLKEAGLVETAREELETLSLDRSFYGFAAAQLLGRAYDLNNRPLQLTGPAPALVSAPGLQRTGELLFHDEPAKAHSEWFFLVRQVPSREQEYLAWYAGQEGWYRFAIDAVNEAKAWDRLDLRFPMAYQDTFVQLAQKNQVPHTELLSIARRESAFFPQAASPVGARGLMQLMPYTARHVAGTLGEPDLVQDLYDVNNNVSLGSAYYRQLTNSFGGNRVLALAAYNAGPHRVRAWRSKKGHEVPVLQWVESIPFRETRDYVKNVLAYNVVYQSLQGEEAHLFNDVELAGRY